MAGITFKLEKILSKHTLASLSHATLYSLILSSGNWLIVVVSVFVFALISEQIYHNALYTQIIQNYLTYVFALSLIVSSPIQLVFTRYMADRFFERDTENVIPNFFGAIVLSLTFGFLAGLIAGYFLFKDLHYIYILVFAFTISIISAIWIILSFLVAFKKYSFVFNTTLITFIIFGVLFIYLLRYGIFYGFVAFTVTLIIYFFIFVIKVVKETYISKELIRFDFLDPDKAYYSLAFIGFFYNFGIWIDKILFWFNPYTSEAVFGNIRFSVVYDLPIILAYISILPGISVQFLKVESEYVKYYENYFKHTNSSNLLNIYKHANLQLNSLSNIFFQVIRIQLIFSFLFFFFEDYILSFFKIPLLYKYLLNVLLIGAFLQLVFGVLFTFLSYYDRRKELLIMTATFAILNLILTYLTQKLGPSFYGYGYTISLLISDLIGIYFLRRYLNEINYHVFVYNIK